MELTEHMWCRWCGAFGITDLMVCSDSACLTKDMTQGALAGLKLTGTFTITSQIQTQVASQYAILVGELDKDMLFTTPII